MKRFCGDSQFGGSQYMRFACALLLASNLLVAARDSQAQLPTLSSLPVLASGSNQTSSAPSKSTPAKSAPTKDAPTEKAIRLYVNDNGLYQLCVVRLAKTLQTSKKRLNGQQKRLCRSLVALQTKGKKKVLVSTISWSKKPLPALSNKNGNLAVDPIKIDASIANELKKNSQDSSASSSSEGQQSSGSSSSSSQSSSASSTSSSKSSSSSSKSSSSSSAKSSSSSSSKSSSSSSSSSSSGDVGSSIKLYVYDSDFNALDREFTNGETLQPYETICFNAANSIASATFKLSGAADVDDTGGLICAAGKTGSDLNELGLSDGNYAMTVVLKNTTNAALGTVNINFVVNNDSEEDD